MEFTIGRKTYSLTSEQVETCMRDVTPEGGRSGRRHFVVIGKREYPITQVLPEVLGLSRADVTTYRARDILKRLGFEVIERAA